MKTRPIRNMVQVETAMSPPFGALSLLPLDIVEKLIQKFDRIEEIGRLQAMHPVFERVIEKIFWHRVDSLIIKCTWLKVCPEGQHVWRLGKLDFTSGMLPCVVSMTRKVRALHLLNTFHPSPTSLESVVIAKTIIAELCKQEKIWRLVFLTLGSQWYGLESPLLEDCVSELVAQHQTSLRKISLGEEGELKMEPNKLEFIARNHSFPHIIHLFGLCWRMDYKPESMLVRVLPDASGGGINFNDVEPLPSIFFVLQRTFVKRVIFEDAWPYLMLADVQKKLADNQFVSFVEDLVLVHNTNYPVFFMHAMRLHAAKIQKMERRAVEGDAQLPSPTHLLSIFPFLKSLHVRERVETHMILKQIPSESLAKNFLAKSLGAIGAMLLEVYGSSAVPVSIEFICWDSFQQMQCDYLRDSLKTRLPTCPVDERIVSQTGKEVELTIAQGRTSVCFLIRIPPLA